MSLIPTPAFFRGLREDEELAIDLAPGVRLLFELEAIGEPDKRGMRTVLVRVNGQLRPVEVRDHSVKAAGAQIERADPKRRGHVPAPVTGIVSLLVAAGDAVAEGDPTRHARGDEDGVDDHRAARRDRAARRRHHRRAPGTGRSVARHRVAGRPATEHVGLLSMS